MPYTLSAVSDPVWQRTLRGNGVYLRSQSRPPITPFQALHPYYPSLQVTPCIASAGRCVEVEVVRRAAGLNRGVVFVGG
jgi:hypothetical protein